MRIFIEPNDVLMFRDGRPFSGGDDHFARGSCPPPPSTLYGALRSYILSLKWSEFYSFTNKKEKIPEDIRKEIGTPYEPGILALRQFLLARTVSTGIEPVYPMPKDISWQKGHGKKEMFILAPQEFTDVNIRTDMPQGLFHMWHPIENALEQASGFLSGSDMEKYLLGKCPEKSIEEKEIFVTEERTGIWKSKSTRSVKEGGLYSVGYFRFQKSTGFIADVSGVQSMPREGILRFGGDHRSAYYMETSWHDISVDPVKKMVAEKTRFKLILLSPAIFTNGWLPGGIDPHTMSGQIGDVDVKLVGACLGRPIGIGGFDLARKVPKVMKRAVPAGSVYLFEVKRGNIYELFERVWLNSISDERAQEGFGISLIGGC